MCLLHAPLAVSVMAAIAGLGVSTTLIVVSSTFGAFVVLGILWKLIQIADAIDRLPQSEKKRIAEAEESSESTLTTRPLSIVK